MPRLFQQRPRFAIIEQPTPIQRLSPLERALGCDGALAHTYPESFWDRARQIADAALSGSVYRPVGQAMWGRDEQETLRKLHEWNQPIHRVRGRIEKIFGTIAYNLKRTVNILAAA